jgi:cytochrome c
MMKLRTAAVVLSAFAFSTGAYAEGDIEAGMKVFKKCKACHNIDKEKNKVGPHLIGVVDRAAAMVEGYKYSKAMKAKGAEGLMWTEENLDAYLLKPKAFVPKTKMAFPGVKKPEDRANVIAYIKSKAKAE